MKNSGSSEIKAKETLSLSEFVKNRKAEWNKFEEILERFSKFKSGGVPPTYIDLNDFDKSYKNIVSDMIFLRKNFKGSQEYLYIKRLVNRALAHLYPKEKLTIKKLINMLIKVYPQVFRRNIHLVILALSIFICGFLIGFFSVDSGSRVLNLFIDEEMINIIETQQTQSFAILKLNVSSKFHYFYRVLKKIDSKMLLYGFLMISLGFIGGIVPTVLLLLVGMYIGCVFTLFYESNELLDLITIIIPEFPWKFFVFLLIATSSFCMGTILIFWDSDTNTDKFKEKIRDALILFFYAAVLLFMWPIFYIIIPLLFAGVIQYPKIYFIFRYMMTFAVMGLILFHALSDFIFKFSEKAQNT